MPSISSFITCDPPNSVPVQPTKAYFHASGRVRKSPTIPWLPGGRKCRKFRIVSSSAVLLPIQLEATPTTSNSVGKNARKTLNAIACEIMLQRGYTRPNIRHTRLVNWPPRCCDLPYSCTTALESGALLPSRRSSQRHGRRPHRRTSVACFLTPQIEWESYQVPIRSTASVVILTLS